MRMWGSNTSPGVAVTSNRARGVEKRKIGTAEKATCRTHQRRLERASKCTLGAKSTTLWTWDHGSTIAGHTGTWGFQEASRKRYNLKKAASLGAPFGVILTNFDESLGMHLARELNFSMVTRDFESGVSRAISWRSRGAANFARLVAVSVRALSYFQSMGSCMWTIPCVIRRVGAVTQHNKCQKLLY